MANELIIFDGPVWPAGEPDSVLHIELTPIALDASLLGLSDLRMDSDVVEAHKVQVPAPAKE